MEAFKKKWEAFPHKGAVVRSIGFTLYFILGIGYFNGHTDWGLFDCIFFTTITLTTVGYGYKNTYPQTDPQRAFSIFFILIGVYVVFYELVEFLNSELYERLQTRFTSRFKMSTGLYAHQRVYIQRMGVAMFSIFILLLVGALFFMANEGWGFTKAFYFAVETATTVGYGDIEPAHQSSKAFLILYLIVSTSFFSFLIGNINSLSTERRKMDRARRALNDRKLLELMPSMAKKGHVSESEFVLAMLEHMGKINIDDDVKQWVDKFHELDVNKDGKLTKTEIAEFSTAEDSMMMESPPSVVDELSSMVRESIASIKDTVGIGSGAGQSTLNNPLIVSADTEMPKRGSVGNDIA